MIHHEVLCGGQLFRISIEPVNGHAVATPKSAAFKVYGIIEARYMVSFKQLRRPTRGSRLEADARAVAAWLFRQCGWTTEQIARVLNRKRSAVSHEIKSVRDRMETEPKFRAEAEALLRELKG